MSGSRRRKLSAADCLVAGDLLLLKRRLPQEILVNIFRYHLPPSTHGFRQQFRDEFTVLNALRAQQYATSEAILRAISNRERRGVIKLLIDRGFDVNAYDRDYQETALMRAAADGIHEIAELLLHHGARTEPTNALHESALLLSISHAHFDITHLLLQHGAFVNAVNDAHETPLIVACYAGHVRLVERLLHHGADLGLADDRGVTALMVAARKGHYDVVQLLLHHGAIDDDRDNDGRTALMLTVTESHDRSVDIARLLLDSGSPIEAIDRFGQTALILAASQGDAQAVAVQLLLKRKADGNAVDFEGRTALMRAVATGSYKVVSILLNYGVAVNSSTRKKETALSISLAKELHDLASLLIRNGAILNGKLLKSARRR